MEPNVLSDGVRPCSVALEPIAGIDHLVLTSRDPDTLPGSSDSMQKNHKEKTIEEIGNVVRQSFHAAVALTGAASIECISLITDDEEDPRPMEHANFSVQNAKNREKARERKLKRKTANERHNDCFRIKCRSRGRCKESFESDDAMMYHVANYHAKGVKKTFVCHLCEKTYSTLQSLRRHLSSVHDGLRPFNCPFPNCSKSFARKDDLQHHTNGVHTKTNAFKCKKCTRKFYYRGALTKHLAFKHGDGITYFCYLCKKKMYSKIALESHMNSLHTRRILYQCPILSCSKFFTRKNVLKLHTNAIHTMANAFKCTKCSDKFYQKHKLARHLANKHGKGVKYDCYLCKERLYDRRKLQQHMNVKHTGLNLVKCPTCSKGFATKTKMKVHLNGSRNMCGREGNNNI